MRNRHGEIISRRLQQSTDDSNEIGIPDLAQYRKRLEDGPADLEASVQRLRHHVSRKIHELNSVELNHQRPAHKNPEMLRA